MITVRASLMDCVYSGRISKSNLVDIITFSPEVMKAIHRYNLLYDLIFVLKEDEPYLNKYTKDKTYEYFGEDRDYFVNYLMENHVRVDGLVKQMTRWKFVDELNMVKYINGKRFEECTDIKIKHNHNVEEFLSFINEYELKLLKINNGIRHLLSMYEFNKTTTLRGIQTKRKKWNTNTKGLRFEKVARDMLKCNNWKIDDERYKKINLFPGVNVSGKNDGHVIETPCGDYNNCRIEVKSIPNSSIKIRHIMQIHIYRIIFDSDILLITKESQSDIKIQKYRKEALEYNWNQIKDKMEANSTRLKNLLDIVDLESYFKLRKMMNQKYINF